MRLPLIYHWRNLLVRKLSTSLTLIVVAVVVFVLSVLLSFAAGIRASLKASGSSKNVLVLAQGATAESMSLIFPDQATKLAQTPGVARDENGSPIISQELCVQTSIPRRDESGSMANVAIRGVDPIAFSVHEEFRLIEGRVFAPGQKEVLVGKAARDRYLNLDIGDRITFGRLGNREFEIVGVFEASGSAIESEIWAPRTILADVYNRPQISSALIRLDVQSNAGSESSSGSSKIGSSFSAQLDALTNTAIEYINGPTVGLESRTETAYYDSLSSKQREIVWLTTVLIGIMAVGATFAVANTMYAAVDGRKREIAMLRTIGFSGWSIVFSFVTESLLLCVSGCLMGLFASVFVSGSRQDFFSDATYTVLAYELKMTPGTVLIALSVSTFVGVIGAAMPARRASRTRIIEALRRG